MALQSAAFLSGKIDNVVFYKRSGTYIARAVAAEVKQSAATKQRSKNFGVAASAGKTLRQLLLPVLPYPKDKRMQSKFSGVISQWLKLSNLSAIPPINTIPFVNGFSFNENTAVAERWRLPFTVTQPAANLLQVHIPAFVPTTAISAPAYTATVELSITAASCRLTDASAIGSFTVTVSIPFDDTMVDARVLSFPVSTEQGALIVTAASLNYELTNGQKDIRPAFMPSSVIDARYC